MTERAELPQVHTDGPPSPPVEVVERALAAALDSDRVLAHAPLASRTTFRIGGTADWLLETDDGGETAAALEAARDLGLPVTVLGGGSNVLVSDRGVRGLVVRLRHGRLRQTGPDRVRVSAGVTLNALVRWTINRGLAGLERWAGTPGTVGGALHGNAHFDGEPIGSHVLRVGIVDAAGVELTVPGEAMGFAYDTSRLQGTGEVALWAEVAVRPGEIPALREAARASLRYRKRTQPLAAPSAGCVFQNPPRDAVGLPPDVPVSAGALIDRAGLKGVRIGGAQVSPRHANFIVSDGTASASDVRALVERCRAGVRDHFGITLREEIVYVGEF